MIPCVYPECDVAVKRRNDLAEHLENECLYRLEICRLCNEQVNLNAMKVKFSPFLVTGICLLVLVRKTLNSTLPRLYITFRQWLIAICPYSKFYMHIAISLRFELSEAN